MLFPIWNTYVPITQFTDTDQYNGSNPSTSTAIGLSEYTNANFFSDDTIFVAEIYSPTYRHYFPYPKETSTDLQDYENKGLLPRTIIAEDGVEDLGIWIAKERDGEKVTHFLKPTYHTIDAEEGEETTYFRTFYRDETCHADYAERLIPRAVGYSAGVLDYFFRGKIEITRPSISGGSITLRAQNITEGKEEMSDGEIKLVVRYSRDGEVYYALADSNTTSIPRGNPVELAFSNVIPSDARDIILQVVYRGVLGLEADAVAVGLKRYGLIIVLRKEQQGQTDWWYYDLDKEEGYHKNPNVPLPSKPEIVSKYIEEDDGTEYYAKMTPALEKIATGECEDGCGFINFNKGDCCGDPQYEFSEDEWYSTPCCSSGVIVEVPDGEGCLDEITCSGGCFNEGTSWGPINSLTTPALRGYRTISGNNFPCPEGYSWSFSIDNLVEKIDIDRNLKEYSQSGNTPIIQNAVCGPYESRHYGCWQFNPSTCVCYYTSMGEYGCFTAPYCTGLMGFGEQGRAEYWRIRQHYAHWYPYQGCVLWNIERALGIPYYQVSANLNTKIEVDGKVTRFNGSWNQEILMGWRTVFEVRRGISTDCMNCPPYAGDPPDYGKNTFSFTESSYGVGGWHTIVLQDGRFAVLIPKLDCSATASVLGSEPATGSIKSTTTALLRIVDGGETDYGLATADEEDILSKVPEGREDLGIKPNGTALPLDIELRGLHWYGDNAFLVAFVLQDVFYAFLLEKDKDTGWQATQLTGFEQWVSENKLEGHLMFLN